MSVYNYFALILFLAIFPKSSSKVKIVGGDAINIQAVPYQVALYRNDFFCGGAIIDSRTIITAAHCTADKDNLRIRAGSKSRSSGGQLVSVSEVFQHELYENINHDFDVSILKLEEDLRFNENVKPVILPDENFEYVHDMPVRVSGWGYTSDGGEDAEENLRSAELKILDRNICNSIYSSTPYKITERMICATSNGTDACQGDSGGPLVAKHVLVGVISWGMNCADGKFPGVYANVRNLLPWIRSKMFLARSNKRNVEHVDGNNWVVQGMIISNAVLAVLSFGLFCLVVCLWTKMNSKVMPVLRILRNAYGKRLSRLEMKLSAKDLEEDYDEDLLED